MKPRFYVPVDDRWEAAVHSDYRMAAACLLNLIHWKWICWRGDDDGFVRLKTEYLRSLIGRREVPVVRKQLVDAGVIEWDRRYCEGSSMRYRLIPQFRKTRMIQCDDKRITRRIRRLQREDECRLLPVHRWLQGQLSLLEFDFDRARSIVDGIIPDEDCPLTVTEYRQLILEQLSRLDDQLTEGNPDLTVCRHGRVHTAVTRLPRSLRCCLSIDGQPLHGLDLANSQPLFLGLVANRFFTSRHERGRLKKWEPARKPRPSRGTGRHPPITVAKKSQPVGGEEGYESCLDTVFGQQLSGDDIGERAAGLDEYLQACQDGVLYERLMGPDEERGRFKRRLFADVLYGRDRYPSELRQRFHRTYPAIGFVLEELKAGDYRRPSWTTQLQESKLFIGGICNRIRNENPDIPLVTVHDSVATTPDFVEYVKAVAVSEFAKLGVAPTFHRETF